jgi:hypothetical protein
VSVPNDRLPVPDSVTTRIAPRPAIDLLFDSETCLRLVDSAIVELQPDDEIPEAPLGDAPQQAHVTRRS